MFAVRDDGLGWRAIDSADDVGHGETLATELPPPSSQYEAEKEKAWRDSEIVRVKWVRERHRDESDLGAVTTLTTTQFTELLAYIQELRDWPESSDFPKTEKRPKPAAWIPA